MGRIFEANVSDPQVIDPFVYVDRFDPDLVFYPVGTAALVTVNGSIDVGSDTDAFRITLKAGDRLILDVDRLGLTGSLDSIISVFQPGGTLLGTFDDTVATDSGSISTRDSFVDLTVTVTGTYDFVIGAFANISTGDYRLRVSVVAPLRSFNGTAGSDTLFGGFGDDTVSGYAAAAGADTAADVLSGGAGNDRLDGSGGNDLLDGGSNRDLLIGATGNDIIDGGSGEDTLRGGAGDDLLRGDGNEGFAFTPIPFGGDRLFGGAGSDTLEGGRDGDTLSGGDGNDVLAGATVGQVLDFAGDFLDGGAGNDTIFGDEFGDLLLGGDGDDRLVLAAFSSTGSAPFADGGDGLDTLNLVLDFRGSIFFAFNPEGGTVTVGNINPVTFTYLRMEQFSLVLGITSDTVTGGAANDTIDGGTGGADILSGRGGNDVLIANVGTTARLDGGDGNDQITAAGFGNILLGSAGNDSLRLSSGGGGFLDGGSGADTLDAAGSQSTLCFGGTGDDRVVFGRGSHFADGGSGADVLVVDWGSLVAGQTLLVENFSDGGGRVAVVGSNSDALDWDSFERIEFTAGGGDDTLGGTIGNDLLVGGGGADLLAGGNGADTLDGGTGMDTLTGGAGNDVFRIRAGQGDADRIADFTGNGSGAGDRIELIGYGAGASLTAAAGVNKWRIDWSGADEIITVIGVLVPSDYSFV